MAQPFRAGYEPDRRVAIHGPDDYRRNRTAPNPLRARQNSVLVTSRTTEFSGFFMEFVDPDAPTATATATATPAGGDGGSGLGLVLRALLITLVARRPRGAGRPAVISHKPDPSVSSP